MCCIYRWIETSGHALRGTVDVAPACRLHITVLLAIVLIQSFVNHAVGADEYPGSSAVQNPVPVNGPTMAAHPSGPSSQPTAVRPATHQDPEPSRFVPATADKPIMLPAPSHDSSGERSSSGPRPLGAIVTVVISLAVVLGLFFGVAWLMRRSMPSAARRLPSEAVELLGRTPLASRQQMHLIRFGNKMLLVCVSPTGVDTLGEITDPHEIDRLAGLCAQTESSSATTAFKQIFGQLARDRSPAAARTAEVADA